MFTPELREGAVMANPQIDLSALAVERTSPSTELRLPRRWFSRVILPVGLIAGFAGLFLYSSWGYFAPSVPVTVVPVLARTGTVEASGQELFKANGWIEPRPSATDVPVQTEGMYRAMEVAVVPGDRVKAGQLLVRFDDERAKLDYLAAQRRHEKRKAAQRAASADLSRTEVAVRNAEATIALATQEGSAEVKSLAAEVTRALALQKSADIAVQVEERLKNSGGLNSDIQFNGGIVFTGGIGADNVIFNLGGGNYSTFSGAKSLQINNNGGSAGTARGIFLDPNGTIQITNAVVLGRVFGGDTIDFQLVSGASVTSPVTAVPLPPAAWSGLVLLAGVGGFAWVRRRRALSAI